MRPVFEFEAVGLGPARITPREFQRVKALARQEFGLDLRSGKEGLVLARLGRRVRDLGLSSIGAYVDVVMADRTGEEMCRMIDLLTTNHTSFWREPDHFALLTGSALPERLSKGGKARIWSAACASGEEPYSILMAAAEAGLDASRIELVGADISSRALRAAQEGVYEAERIASLPVGWRRRYFQAGVGDRSGWVRVRKALRDAVRFERRNLLDPFCELGRFHAIFCRNVMIYFDKEVQERLVNAFAESLEPGGWLFIGHSEGLAGIRHPLRPVAPAVYRKS
jgi:chemotaxis protein methyltransferase CheR